MASKPNFSAELPDGAVTALQSVAAILGLMQTTGPGAGKTGSIGQLLVHIAAGETLVMMTALDTSGAMRATAARIRGLAEAQDDDDMQNVLGGLADALDSTAKIKAEFETDED